MFVKESVWCSVSRLVLNEVWTTGLVQNVDAVRSTTSEHVVLASADLIQNEQKKKKITSVSEKKKPQKWGKKKKTQLQVSLLSVKHQEAQDITAQCVPDRHTTDPGPRNRIHFISSSITSTFELLVETKGLNRWCFLIFSNREKKRRMI